MVTNVVDIVQVHYLDVSLRQGHVPKVFRAIILKSSISV